MIQYQTSRLDGIIPYSVIRGNHDVTANNGALLYDKYYSDPNQSYYQHVAANGGFHDPTTTKNSYLLFTVGQVDYLILNRDFATTDDVLEWANGVLAQYPNHRVIVATHGYLYSNGNTVHQILSNPQYSDELSGGLGFVTLMHFTEDGSIVRLESYSTVMQKYFRETNYDLTLELGAPPAQDADQPTDAEPSQGDSGNLYVIIAVAGIVVVALVVTVILLRKKKAKKD